MDNLKVQLLEILYKGLLCIGSTWQMWYQNRAHFMVLPGTVLTISKLSKLTNKYTKNHHTTTCPHLQISTGLKFLSNSAEFNSSICQCLARMLRSFDFAGAAACSYGTWPIHQGFGNSQHQLFNRLTFKVCQCPTDCSTWGELLLWPSHGDGCDSILEFGTSKLLVAEA